jgi:hypothetical protein
MERALFAIERWYERFAFTVKHMLSSSDCESRTVGDLPALEPGARERLDGLRLGYTEVAGSAGLRTAIAESYEGIAPDDVLVLAAAEEGIFTFWHAVPRPGDRAVVETRASDRRSRSRARPGRPSCPGRAGPRPAGRTTSSGSGAC